MCGDSCCPSCGPAQGNSRCPICSAWASEGCEHFNSRTGNLKKRYEAQAKRNAEAERMAEDQAAQDWAEEARLADEYFAANPHQSTMSREEIERLCHE